MHGPEMDAAWLAARLRPVAAALPVAAVGPEWLLRLPEEGRDLVSPFPELRAADWLRYLDDGDRDHYERIVAERHRLLSAAVLAAGATGEAAAVDRVLEGVRAFVAQASWCWPAHDDAPERGGRLPDPARPFLDLGAGEVAAQLAWTDHLVGGLLEARAPGVRSRIRREVEQRVLGPFLGRDDWHWLGLDGDVHNWLPWIAGNVLTASLVLVEDDDRRATIVEKAVSCLERYVAALPSDGAIDEGYGYWWNGACRALEALDLLEYATDGALAQWRDSPALRATVGFPAAMHLGGDWWVNVADGSARPSTDLAWPSLFRAAEALGDPDARALALSRRTGRATSEVRRLGRLVRELADERWWSAPAVAPGLPRDAWYGSVQLLVARERGGTSDGLALVAKGGHNGEHHNHNDVGSFIVALDGVPVVVDLGRPSYTSQTFSADRYSIWTMQSAWHNVPEIRGLQQAPGAAFAARDVAVSRTDRETGLVLDLAGAYPETGVDTWRRTLRLDRVAGRVMCTDRWSGSVAEGTPGSVAVLVVAGTVRTVDERELRVTPVEGAGELRIVSDQPMRVARRSVDDQVLTRVWGSWVNQIKIDLGSDNNSQVSVWFEAVKEEVTR